MEKLIMQFMCSSLQENFNKLQPSIPHMGLQSPILSTFLQPLMQCILNNQHFPIAAERSIKYTRLHRQTRIARRIVIGSLHWLSQHLHTYKNGQNSPGKLAHQWYSITIGHPLYGMKRKAFLPMQDTPKPKMTTSATLGLGKNCPHNYVYIYIYFGDFSF